MNSGGQQRKVVGGFDMIYNNGAVSRDKSNLYASNLGMHPFLFYFPFFKYHSINILKCRR